MATYIGIDGLEWNDKASTEFINKWAITYSDNLKIFVAVSYNDYNKVVYSSDGSIWYPIIKGDAPGQLS